jgi:hypothetical protein
VQVKHCASSYPLPPGLEPGDWVKILSFDAGYYKVENAGGQTFSVFLANVVESSPKEKGSATAGRQSHNTLPPK